MNKSDNPPLSVPLPKRGRPSLVATHPHRAAIEQALANGVGLKILAPYLSADKLRRA